MDWIDNADSYICPVCGKEVSSPAKYSGCMCPRCGFHAENDKYLNIEELNSAAISNLQAENEKLRSEAEGMRSNWYKSVEKIKKLRAELEQARTDCAVAEKNHADCIGELEQVKRALAMMWFAYVNKDGEFPHEYEEGALDEAELILGPWEECMPKYLRNDQKED